jgi:hypothetical protein
MTMKLLRQGSRGPRVELLQRLLNLEKRTSTCAEDGIFGPMTREAVEDFQSRRPLKQDGIVGPRTWQALGLRHEIEHHVTLKPQPTNASCWSAAASMLLGPMSVGVGGATRNPGGGLPSGGGTNIEAFARSHGLTMHYPMNRPVEAFASLLRRGPLWVAGVQSLGVRSGGRQSMHAVVVGALWGNGSREGTMLQIYDPWPVGRGSVYGTFYGERIASSPMGMAYILQR